LTIELTPSSRKRITAVLCRINLLNFA
jgi:hypothetical protein